MQSVCLPYSWDLILMGLIAAPHMFVHWRPYLWRGLIGIEMTAGVRRGDAKRVFTLQLGPYFDGFDRCAPHVCALAALFMARINRDRNDRWRAAGRCKACVYLTVGTLF